MSGRSGAAPLPEAPVSHLPQTVADIEPLVARKHDLVVGNVDVENQGIGAYYQVVAAPLAANHRCRKMCRTAAARRTDSPSAVISRKKNSLIANLHSNPVEIRNIPRCNMRHARLRG